MAKKDMKDIKINLDEFKINEKDTGSVEVQVAQLTEHITRLTEHFRSHPKDFASKRGMIQMVARRRKSLQYLERKNVQTYKTLIERLGLRK
ncbi:MAG: 30S ribosomal protein S15 [Candidatus Babeliales bacterium]